MVDWEHEGARWFIAIVYTVAMTSVYFYVLQPILVDFSPIFAYDPEGVRPGPRGLGELMYFVFLFGVWFLYASIGYIISDGLGNYLLGIRGLLLFAVQIMIPNEYIPERYLPDDTDDDW